ncbi:MAG: hypothetical protein AUH75_06935 [Gemmatimonadetes bacterium 13_1_40CM_4_65_7]|nr:MAG: hypothetical protein AUH75_06935 [Gemmatimonadetes bacterium 13_1_40CM_4_65_7]
MIDTTSLAEDLTQLEGLLRALLTPQQYDSCAALLPALGAAVGFLRRSSRASLASVTLPDEVLRHRFHLTKREVEVLHLLLQGVSNAGLAAALHVSEHTARHHTERVRLKLNVHSRAQLPAAIAGRLG